MVVIDDTDDKDFQPGSDSNDSAHLLKSSGFGGVREGGDRKGLCLLCFHSFHGALRLKLKPYSLFKGTWLF